MSDSRRQTPMGPGRGRMGMQPFGFQGRRTGCGAGHRDAAAHVPIHERHALDAIPGGGPGSRIRAGPGGGAGVHRRRRRPSHGVPVRSVRTRDGGAATDRCDGAGAGTVPGRVADQRGQPLRPGGGRPAHAAAHARPDHEQGPPTVIELLRPQRGRRPAVAAGQRHRRHQPRGRHGAVAAGVQLPAADRHPDRHVVAQLAAGTGYLRAVAAHVREHRAVSRGGRARHSARPARRSAASAPSWSRISPAPRWRRRSTASRGTRRASAS